ncbi:MAG TPA: PAS domain S-box protein [Desulfobulbus sp.]|nr:PAS domain S-box protein [Desulfobulbus sp.]
MTGLPLFPTFVTDMAGSVANIIFAFLAMRYAFLLTKKHPENFIWGYLLYICIAISAFSISRAAGHIVKQLFFLTGNRAVWSVISPYSGGFNTLLLISVSAVTLFYHKGVQAYYLIGQKADKLKCANRRLENAAREMKELNLHLEEMNIHLEEKVEERTAELSKSEKKFRHLFSASKDMVFFCDTEHNLMDINESGLEMLGYSPSYAPLLDLHVIFNNEYDVEQYFSSIQEDGYVKDREIQFRRKDGSIIYVLLSATAVFDEQGTMVGCEAIAKDLTRVKNMMEQLVSSEKMASVGQMAAGVAHEINTPLGVILGYAQLMKDDFEKGSEMYQNLEVIERQTRASRKIVADLLKFSRQTDSARENLNLNEVLTDVLAVTEHSLHLDHIHTHLDLAEDLPQVIGDAEKLRQVFVNLINNADHAMEEQGRGDLFLSTEFDRKRKQVVVRIRDTGHGIPKDVKDKIFDPFFTTKPVGKGTGLGLSVSYGIIKDHNGTIEVESPVGSGSPTGNPLPGTVFRIVMPVAAEAAAVRQSMTVPDKQQPSWKV